MLDDNTIYVISEPEDKPLLMRFEDSNTSYEYDKETMNLTIKTKIMVSKEQLENILKNCEVVE